MTNRRFLGILLSSLGLFIAAGLLLAHFGLGLSTHTVLSNSMRPAFAAGDQILTLDITPQQVHRGQVVIVQTPDMPAPIAHRVADVKMIADAVSVRTKGDANASPDVWTNLLPGAQIPVVVAVVPGVPGWLEHGPSTWGIGLQVLIIAGLGVVATVITVALQWRGRHCDCLDCAESTAADDGADHRDGGGDASAPHCPSCSEEVPAAETSNGSSPADSSPDPEPTAPDQDHQEVHHARS